MADRKYRFYLKRDDTHQNIGDEDILVGNRANVGKYTSGLTRGSQYSYVEFTWNELLRAIDATPDPTISLSASTTTVPKSGGTVTVTITVNNGVYDRYEIMPAAQVIVTNPNPSTAILTITIGEDTSGQDIDYDVIGYGRSEDGTKTCSNSVSFTQYWTWALADVDYVVFTYNWGGNDGRDLDSVTFIDGLATASTGDYGYTFERGVGWYNGTLAGGGERYIGPDNNLTNALLRFADDNQSNGAEYTLINFKKLNEIIMEGVSTGKIDLNSQIIVYLMANWWTQRNQGNVSVSFTAYKGGTISRVKESGDACYKYVVTDYDEIKGRHVESGINIFAKSDMDAIIANAQTALETYSSAAAFIYDYEHNSFKLASGNELLTLDGGKRFRGGLQSSKSGNITAYLNDEVVSSVDWSWVPDVKIPVTNTGVSRTYKIVISADINTVSGTSQSSQSHTSQISMVPNSCRTVDPGSSAYDGDIVLTYIGPTTFTVTIPANHMYSGSSEYGYRVYYTAEEHDVFITMAKKGHESYVDILEIPS